MTINKKYILVFALAIIFILWMLTGIYTIDSEGGETTVVLRFGRYVKTIETAGLHWHLPAPIDSIYTEKVREIRTVNIGYTTISPIQSASQYGEYQGNPEESLMFTSDENMVNVETVVQYEISNIEDYLFNVDELEETLFIAAESAIRRVVASHFLDEVLTDNKAEIQIEIKNDLQSICDIYEMGLKINNVVLQDVEAPDAVDDAFKDVTNAREDKNKYINQAQAYENEIIPRARGSAAEIINKAEGYKAQRIAEAEGDVANFLQVLAKYKLGEEVTRTRLYLETMEEILPGMQKYFVTSEDGTFKFLPLDGNSLTGGVN